MDIDKFKEKKQYLLLFSLLLIILIILNAIIKKDNKLDYSKTYSGAQLVSLKSEIKTREIYYSLENIIINFINSYEDDSYRQYYDVLSDEYKKYLSKDEFYEIADNFLKKFLTNLGHGEDSHVDLYTTGIITKIHLYDKDMYIVSVMNSAEGNTGYIGISLNQDNNTYSIFYME